MNVRLIIYQLNCLYCFVELAALSKRRQRQERIDGKPVMSLSGLVWLALLRPNANCEPHSDCEWFLSLAQCWQEVSCLPHILIYS